MKLAPRPSGGFSLVLTLIILTLLAILVVSFLSTSTLDRMTARAFASKTQAELAADTAVSQAVSLLADTIAKYPDSATVWEPLSSPGGLGTEGTVLYYADAPPGDANAQSHLLPLVSRGTDASGQLPGSVLVGDKPIALGAEAWNDSNSVDLNRPRSNDDKVGWIGTPPPPPPSTDPPTAPKPFRAKWVEVREQANTLQKTAPPRVISRYAFWVEDESFKVNLNLLGATSRGSERDIPGTPGSPGAQPGEVPIQGLLRSAHAPTNFFDPLATEARDLRNGFFGKRLLDLPSFNHVALDEKGNSQYPIGDRTKFLATVFSGGLNVSRHGSQRLNLNGLGFDKPLTATSPTDAEIEKQLRQVVETIKFHAPKFGQRFYRLTPSTTTPPTAAWCNTEDVSNSTHRDIYLYKIAANIRDYIDADSQPTLLLPGTGTQPTARISPRIKPVVAMSAHPGTNDFWAQGKDGAPFLQEAVVRFRSSCDDSTKRYNLKVDYYLEFWNMTNEDIYAAPQTDPALRHLNNAFVKIVDPVGWFGHGGGTPDLTADSGGNPDTDREVVIDLSSGVYQNGNATTGQAVGTGVVFKAGACTVITTDPDDFTSDSTLGTTSTTGGKNAATTFYCSTLTGKREFDGPVPKQGERLASSRCDGIWPQFRDNYEPETHKNKDDYGTEVILANSLGWLDSQAFTIAKGGGPLVTYLKSSNGKTKRDDTYGGSLMGNGNTPSALGDPRTNNEQLEFVRWNGGIEEPDQTRYFNPTVSDPQRFSLGWPNSRYTFPDARKATGGSVSGSYPWKDYYRVWGKTASGDSPSVPSPDKNSAPAVIANANLLSIGQLGDIFDPARVVGTKGSFAAAEKIGIARGGGRTLKIGQPDDLVDMSTVDARSQQWAAWRLLDFFDTSSELEIPGLININGLRRDNGAALRAACEGLKLRSISQTVPSAVVAADKTLNVVESATASEPGLQKLINEAVKRLSGDPTKPTYFRERGEFSELAPFSSASSDLTDAKGSETFDHSREELFRRLSSLITTRGNIFSVYAVGQAVQELNEPNKTKRVTGQYAVKVTFALIPRKADGSSFQVKQETFSPSDADAVRERFAQPAHYDVLILQTTPQ